MGRSENRPRQVPVMACMPADKSARQQTILGTLSDIDDWFLLLLHLRRVGQQLDWFLRRLD